jgi:sigma-B regulation protein RsbU (phosphoserine phosphatase)
VTDQAGIKDGDYLLRINGKEFKKGDDAQQMINRLAGGYATYFVERNGAQFETRVQILKLFNLPFLAQSIFGFGFLLVGYIVVMAKPQGKIQRMFARYSFLLMLFFGGSAWGLDPSVNPLWRIWIIRSSFILATVLGMPLFVRFFLHFPVRRKGQESKLLIVILYSLSILIALMFVLSLQLKNLNPYLIFAAYARVGFFILGFIIFIHSYFALVPKDRRNQLRPILIGVATGLTVFAYVIIVQRINPLVVFLNPVLLLPVVLLILVPMFFGYAIFRYRLMDVDVVIRRSLIYGAVTTSLAAIYLVSVYGIGTLVNYFFGVQENHLLVVISLVVVAFVFDPVKQRFQNGIDKLFFRERYDYQRALLEFTQELPRLMEMEHILHSIVQRLSSTMHIEKISVFICGEKEGCEMVAQNLKQADYTFSDGNGTLMALLQKTRKPIDLHLLGDEYDSVDLKDEEKQKLILANVVLTVPMLLQDRLVGFINVGPKMSGKVYSQEDINLLATVAGQAAISIDNARLHKAEIQQERIKDELEMARKIQQGLFPKENPQIPGLDISGISIPASSIGGDYYDFIQLGPQKILAVVADVAGKGMSAALYMSKIQGMVQLAAHMYETPKDMLTNINRRIFEGLDRKSFITMILALFDLKEMEVRICRAGHNKALISTNGIIQFLEGGGIGLGLERGPLFENTIEEVRIQIKPDNLFLFYTDGITESMNDNKQQLGEDAVIDLLKTNRNLPANEIQQAILQKVNSFRGSAEQHDDVTMVVVKSI